VVADKTGHAGHEDFHSARDTGRGDRRKAQNPKSPNAGKVPSHRQGTPHQANERCIPWILGIWRW
jgi:hypothetical protein